MEFDVAAMADENVPARHEEHTLEPAADAYFPEGQGVQNELAVTPGLKEYVPASHFEQFWMKLAPGRLFQVPGGQLVHDTHPVLYVPAVQLIIQQVLDISI